MSSEPILLVHGFASSFDLNWREPGWVDLMTEAGREVIAVDILGHGTAEKPHDPAAYDRLELSLVPLLRETPIDAVGFSMGGGLLLRLAAQMPHRFHKLVIGGVGKRNMEESDSSPVADAIEAGSGSYDEDAEGGSLGRAFAQFADNPANDPKALAACMRRTSSPLSADELQKITVPVLVVLGDRDFAGPAEPLVEALPNAKLVTLRGVDHFGTPQHFGFLDAAMKFLDV